MRLPRGAGWGQLEARHRSSHHTPHEARVEEGTDLWRSRPWPVSPPVAVPAAGQVRPVPLRPAAPVAASAHPLLHAGLGAGPQRPPLPLDLPGEGPGAQGQAAFGRRGRRGGGRWSQALAGVAPGPAGAGQGGVHSPAPTALSSGQMTRSQEEFSIHLAQALSYLHSRHRHIKTWAALFIGEPGRRGSRPLQAGPSQRPDPRLPSRPLASARLLRSTGKRGGVAGEGPQPGRTGRRGSEPPPPTSKPPATGQRRCLSPRLHHLLPPPGCVPDAGQR